MTFDPLIPQTSQSPSIFPSQNQSNMGRLQTLFGGDHQFNNTAASDDGYHNLIHMSQQAPTGALTGYGRLYAKIASGIVQLFYMDDAGTEYQLTPDSTVATNGQIAPMNVGSSPTIFADPGYNYTGTATAFIQGTIYAFSCNIMKTGAAASTYGFTSVAGFPSFGLVWAYVGTDLVLSNGTGANQNVSWVLTIKKAIP